MGATRRLAMFPLSGVLYPGAELALHVFESRYRALVDHCLTHDNEFGVVLIARGSEVGGGDERMAVGTAARIEAASPFEDGRWAVLARGTTRIRIHGWLPDDPYPVAQVEDLVDRSSTAEALAAADPTLVGGDKDLARATASVRRVRTLLSELGQAAPVLTDLGEEAADDDRSEGARLWRLCAAAPLTPLDGQRLLETDDSGRRCQRLIELCEALSGDLSLLLGGG
jgi:Lon protease-like protein